MKKQNKAFTLIELLVGGAIVAVVVAVLVLFLGGCSGFNNTLKHAKSSIVGLKRVVTLYSANGEPIKIWKIKATVEDRGGTVWFLDDNGKAVTVSGTFVVQEVE